MRKDAGMQDHSSDYVRFAGFAFLCAAGVAWVLLVDFGLLAFGHFTVPVSGPMMRGMGTVMMVTGSAAILPCASPAWARRQIWLGSAIALVAMLAGTALLREERSLVAALISVAATGLAAVLTRGMIGALGSRHWVARILVGLPVVLVGLVVPFTVFGGFYVDDF